MIANSQEVTIHYHASTLSETDRKVLTLPLDKIYTVIILVEDLRPNISQLAHEHIKCEPEYQVEMTNAAFSTPGN